MGPEGFWNPLQIGYAGRDTRAMRTTQPRLPDATSHSAGPRKDMTDRNIAPRQARHLFLQSKKGTVKQSSYRAYRFPTRHFTEHLEAQRIDSMREVDGFHIENWKVARRSENIAPATLKSNVKHVATYLRWCERTNIVQAGLGEKIEIPNIAIEDEASHKRVSHERSLQIRNYLSTFEYGTRQHALFALLWETGCRISGAISLDLGDFSPDEKRLEFHDRKDTGTALKNGTKGERNLTLSDDLIRVLTDYVGVQRHDVWDDFNRKPLFTTKNGRVTRQRVYKNVVGFTRPCIYKNTCPHGKDIERCEAAQKKKKAYDCPSSTSMHPVRRGSITYHLNQGWPKEKVSERCDVSLDVLDKHYNEQTKEDERATRKKYIDRL